MDENQSFFFCENKPTKRKLSLSITTPLHLDPFMQIPAQVDIAAVLLPLLEVLTHLPAALCTCMLKDQYTALFLVR